MHLVESVRRLAAPVAGLLGAAAVCVACSSTISGTPASPAGGSASASVGLPTVQPSLSLSVPESILPSITELPTLGSGGGSQFCTDFSGQALSSIGSDPAAAVALWDKLAADAPDEIKGDVQAVDDYLHAAVSGDLNGADSTKLGTAAQHIGTYVATHCVGN